jgi:hypothetical protein
MEAEVAQVPPILVPVKAASKLIGRCPASIYNLLGSGKIRAVKSGVRTLIVVESLREYANSLPAGEDRPAAISDVPRPQATCERSKRPRFGITPGLTREDSDGESGR